jgi:hypothetical protein
MSRSPTILALAAAVGTAFQLVVAQTGPVIDDRLPPASIETKRNDPPATSAPWQLAKPGDPLYDAKKEAEIKNNKHSHLVHVFERGVFKGYGILGHHGDDWTLDSGPTPQPIAKKMDSAFTSNPKLPPDAIELSKSEHPEKSDYFPTRPKLHPANVPKDYIPVRVFHRGKFIGWTFMSKDAVAMLHKPNET